MKQVFKVVALAIIIGSLVNGLAMAAIGDDDKPIISVSPYLGNATWDSDLGLGDGFIYGGRVAFHAFQWLSLEGTYGYNSSNRDVDNTEVGTTHLGVDLVAELMPTSRFNPYLSGGWAQLNYRPDIGTDYNLNGLEAGVGLKIRLAGSNARYSALRLDVRDVMSDFCESFADFGNTKHNIISTVGIQFAFGKSSKDTDGDGVADRDDACSATPAGAYVDATGCPTDSDGDGVFDGLDKCDGTPVGATADAYGCTTDSDGDGVFDGLDKCNGTPAGAVVNASGCPKDSDGDGVFDGIDQCAGTEAHLQVDLSGCPIAVTAMEVQLLDTGSISTSSIVFKTSSADLNLEDIATLNEIGAALANWPELRVEIGGYTDSSGSEAFNQKLSQKRANAVLDYLVVNYPAINIQQYTAVGYGEANPIADNSTSEGMRANRRVEFKVLNTDQLKREIESRKMLER